MPHPRAVARGPAIWFTPAMENGSLIALPLTIALIALICLGTLSPHPLVSAQAIGNDKLRHFLGFGSIVVPAALFRPRWLLFLIPFAIALGGVVELIQPFVGRDLDIRDFYADSLGVAVAAATASLVRLQVLRSYRARRV